MCEATVYVERNGQRERVLKGVIKVEITDQGIVLTSLVQPPQMIQGAIRQVDLLKHSVTLTAERKK
jgi:predicted RNA-binding protein